MITAKIKFGINSCAVVNAVFNVPNGVFNVPNGVFDVTNCVFRVLDYIRQNITVAFVALAFDYSLRIMFLR